MLERKVIAPLHERQDAQPQQANRIAQTVTGDRATTIGIVEREAVVNITYGTAPLPTGELNPFGVPFQRNYAFTGRETVLEKLHKQLLSNDKAAMTQVQAISGLGGIGKTQTAVEYAYRYYPIVYKTVLWVTADNAINLATDFARIADQLALPNAATMKQEEKVSAVKAWLNNHQDWLLIFDNADEPTVLGQWMPTNPAGKVLVTSRASVLDAVGIPHPIALDVLTAPEAVALLYERTGIV